MSKIDRYLIHAFDAVKEQIQQETKESFSSSRDPVRLPMIIHVKNPSWDPTSVPDCTILARFDTIIACLGSLDTVQALKNDPMVLRVEASRPGSGNETRQSVPFVNANSVHIGRFAEKGEKALIAIIDSDIDVLHEAFRDASGMFTRILAVWDQTDSSGVGPRVGRFGTEHTEKQINSYIQTMQVPVGLQRVPGGHGTHVASIAAGRPVSGSQFLGGVAPEANIIVVIPSLQVGPTDPFSLGYSTSLLAALSYIDDMANRLDLPVVVNLSQGMNAGAHDGTSLIEVAFDKFTDGGRAPGRVVVKSAGNERNKSGHAHLNIGSNQSEKLQWIADPHRGQDVIELWFKACDEIEFCLHSPFATQHSFSNVGVPHQSYANPINRGGSASGVPTRRRSPRVPQKYGMSAWIDRSNSYEDSHFLSGTHYQISYEQYHRDNGDSCLTITITPGHANQIEHGIWTLEIVSRRIRSSGDIHAWMERNSDHPIRFIDHVSNETTLTIPGTANTVISVGSVSTYVPFCVSPHSSYGPTRDGRKKPDLAAPGDDISAAQGNTLVDVKIDSGTSMAAPHVTGAIALLLSYWKKQESLKSDWEQLNAAQVRAALSQTTQNYNGNWYPGMGFGVLDVERLLEAFN